MTARLHVIVEGDSEAAFVQHVLAPYLGERGVGASAEKIVKPGEKGGYTSYARLRRHIAQRLRHDRALFVTTMVDLYGTTRDARFPGLADAPAPNAPYARVAHLEEALLKDIDAVAAEEGRRFIPYLQLHEFEALILVAPRQLDWMYIEAHHALGIEALAKEIGDLEPERVNEGDQTAPSKRIGRHIEGYDKVLAASEVVARIGMPLLLARCPHFRGWVERLVALGHTAP